MSRGLKGGILLLAAIASAQQVRPNFTGTWKAINLPPDAQSVNQIEQTATTIAIRPTIGSGKAIPWSVYPIDGGVTSKKVGNAKVALTGHWEGAALVLELTKTLYFRRYTERRVISMTSDGLMKTSFHTVGADARHDHEFLSKKMDDR